MRRVEANRKQIRIEFCVNGEKKVDIYINPSFPGGCRKIHEALAYDVAVAQKTLEAIKGEDKQTAIVDYLQGKFDVAMKLIDGIAEAIGPGQYEEIAEYLPAIDIGDLTSLAVAIVESYSEFYATALKEGFKKNGQ